MKKTLLVLAVSAAALTTNVFASEQITACVNDKTGEMRMVNDSNQCKNRESAVSWNVTGEKGDTGDQGPTGPQGPPGDDGISGLPGVYDGAGNLLGTLMGFYETSSSAYTILSNKGYIFPFRTSSGTVDNSYLRSNAIVYTEPSCTGQAYVIGLVKVEEEERESSYTAPKAMLYNSDARNLWYSGEVLHYIFKYGTEDVLYEEESTGVCKLRVTSSGKDVTYGLLEAYPNDESITGVPNGTVALPIYYE